MSWKQTILAVRELKAEFNQSSRRQIYRIATLLNEVFEDMEFRAENGGLDDLRAAELLDAELRNLDATDFDFLMLRGALKHFPSAEQWDGRSVSSLIAEAAEMSRPRRESNAEHRRRSATVAALEKAEGEAKTWKMRANSLGEEVKATQEAKAEAERERREAEQKAKAAEREKQIAERAKRQALIAAENAERKRQESDEARKQATADKAEVEAERKRVEAEWKRTEREKARIEQEKAAVERTKDEQIAALKLENSRLKAELARAKKRIFELENGRKFNLQERLEAVG